MLVRFVQFIAYFIVLFCLFFANASKVFAGTPSVLVVDLDTKKILYENNSTAERFPASLTKLMTLYITFDKIQKGEINLDDIVVASKHAESQPSSQIYLRQGDEISVYNLIVSLIVHSANDSAVALAEYIGSNEQNFVEIMNQTALKLKMYSTFFVNSNGLHHENQISTAKDIARLSSAVYSDFKDFYPLFSIKEFSYKGRNFLTHNKIVANYSGATGLKTGYVAASGYNIASTARRNGENILTVVMGGHTPEERDIYATELLNYGFDFLAGKIENESTIYAAN